MELKLSRTGINKVGTEMYISDVTDWAEASVTRESVALFFKAIYITSKGEFDVEILPYDPLTVEHITLKTDKDGYIAIMAVAVPETVPVTPGAYGVSNGQIVQLVDDALESKTVTDLINNPLFLDAVTFRTILLARIAIYRNRKNLELIKLKISKFDDRAHNREIADIENQHNFARGLLEGVVYLWCSDNYVQAQEIVEAFNSLIEQDGKL